MTLIEFGVAANGEERRTIVELMAGTGWQGLPLGWAHEARRQTIETKMRDGCAHARTYTCNLCCLSVKLIKDKVVL